MTVITSAPGGPPVEQRDDLVSLTVDGIVISVPKGTLVIRAAEQLGIAIPRFCDHPLLDPAGACRQCLVEVEGQLKPVASCTTTATEGMVVRTQLTSAVAADAQHGVMELLLINHPLDCPVCDKGGECPLQNQAMANGRGESRFDGPKRTFPKPIPLSSPGAPRPRALHLLRPLHPVRRPDRRRPLHRARRARRPPADRRREPRAAVQLLLLRQHRADLPGRRAYRYGVPVPLTSVRPGVHSDCVRALCLRLCPCAPTYVGAPCCGDWPATTRPSTRSGTATRVAGPSTTPGSRTA